MDGIRKTKQHFFDDYGGFADKRLKNIDKGDTFIVDDRKPRDVGADKKLYGYFCMMFAKVVSVECIEVSLRGNIPMSDAVLDWIAETGAAMTGGLQQALRFEVRRGEEGRLADLADRIEAITAPGVSYEHANYKYVCPRTAKSLRRLAATMKSLG